MMHGTQQLRELLRLLEGYGGAAAVEQSLAIEAPQSGGELAAEYLAQDRDGKQEAMTCTNPSGAVGCESSGRDHAVDMRMEQQVLSPCVKDGEEADIGAHVFRVGGHLQQRLSGG